MAIPKGYQRLENSKRHIRPNAKRVRAADANQIISVTITVRRRAGAPPLPEQEHWEASPPGKRSYISTEDFAAHYGADPEDLDAVAKFAVDHGLKVIEKNIAQRIVIVSGKISLVSKAFAVELAQYEVRAKRKSRPMSGPANDKATEHESETYRGREGDIYLPAELVPIVEGVFGLDNRRMARRHVWPPMPAIAPLTPPQVARLYDFPHPSHDIHRETIGLFEFSDPVAGLCGYLPSDISDYFTTPLGIGPGYSTPSLIDIGVNGAANSPGGPGDAEVALDIDVAGSVAQGAHIAVYFTTWDENGWILALKRAIHPHPGEPRPSVISISWGWTELDSFGNLAWTPAVMHAVSAAFQEAAMFGITVLVASGDDGSNCQEYDGTAHVYYPQSDPWVTTCGGTTIGNVVGSSFTEITWNDNGITGGGISEIFPLPHWQRHAHVPHSVNPNHRRGRGLPDIAGYANGYEIVLGGAGSPGWWGTSETAPLYAGLFAILNAHLHQRLGFVNPFLYAHHAHIFRDIADGRSNTSAGAPGYLSGPGWDACTGWGSINGMALLKLLRREEEWEHRDGHGLTGKVTALVFNRFGDFEGFQFEDLHGDHHRFESHEEEIRRVVDRAWTDRIIATVVARHEMPHRPISIILQGSPAFHHHHHH